MATDAYRRWVAGGRVWWAATPIRELEALCRTHRVEVKGVLGNQEHLTADRPQDHTPFSTTWWPVQLDRPIVTAIDFANTDNIGARIRADAIRGMCPWLKYINYGGHHYDSRNAFQPEPSKDEHVHISIRTDWAETSIGGYDPWEGTAMAMRDDDDFHALILRVDNIRQFKRSGSNGIKTEPVQLVVELANFFTDVREGLQRIKSAIDVISPPIAIDYDQLAAAILRQLLAGAGTPGGEQGDQDGKEIRA